MPSIGAPIPTVSGSSFVEEKEPPDVDVLTQTCKVPLEATANAGTVAWSCVVPMNVVDRPKPPGQADTVSPEAKPVPVTVSVKLALPADTAAGAMAVTVRSAGMVRVKGDEGAPPGFVAAITTRPGSNPSMRKRGTATSLIESTTPRLVPFQASVIPCWKPEPFTINHFPSKSPVLYQP